MRAKGLSWEPVKVDLFKAEQYDPKYLKLNPKGVVPTLVHDGKPVSRWLAGAVAELARKALAALRSNRANTSPDYSSSRLRGRSSEVPLSRPWHDGDDRAQACGRTSRSAQTDGLHCLGSMVRRTHLLFDRL
jgi:hypothetical protein